MDSKVYGYINSQSSEHQKILYKLRNLILQTQPDVKEGFKNGVPWYEDKFYVAALRDHVNMGFALGNIVIADKLEGKGRFMRHLKFYSLKDIDEELIINLIKQTESKCQD